MLQQGQEFILPLIVAARQVASGAIDENAAKLLLDRDFEGRVRILGVAPVCVGDVSEAGNLLRVQFESAPIGPAVLDLVEVGVVERQLAHVLVLRLRRETPDLWNVVAALETGHVADAADQRVRTDIKRTRSHNGELMTAGWQDPEKYFTFIQPVALIVRELDARLEKQERIVPRLFRTLHCERCGASAQKQ